MAKKQSKNRHEGLLNGIEHMTQAELEHDLGIGGLTLEVCFTDLFSELFEDLPGYAGPPESEVLKVTQMGPGRRDEKGPDDASTT